MSEHSELADQFTAWVEAYALRVCPEGCLPTPGQEREFALFAAVVRALRGLDTEPRTDWSPPFQLMKLQAREPETGRWVDIYPAQLEQMLKRGVAIRVLEPGDQQ